MKIPVSSTAYLTASSHHQYHIYSSSANGSPRNNQRKAESVLKRMNKLVNGVKGHVKLAPKISETVKGKLSLGAKIIQVGDVDKIFKKLLVVKEEEKLLKACQCYLSTIAGTMAGRLFISTYKVAFCSERSLNFYSSNGELIRVHYKVLNPLSKIKRVNQTVHMEKLSEKYIEMFTVDGFGFWFMGFLNYKKAFKNLQQAVPQFQNCIDDVRVTY